MIQINEQEFKSFLSKNDEPEWLTNYRIKSFNKIKDSPMPDFRHGLNIMVKPRDDFFNFSNPENNPSIDIKINSEELQNTGIKIIVTNSLDKNIESEIPEIKEFFNEKWEDKEDNNKINHFNESLTNKFIIIKIPKSSESEIPIKISYQSNNSINIFSILVIAEENSKSKIILNRQGESSYISENIKLLTKRDSRIKFITSQNFDSKTISFQKRKSICGENSEVDWTDLSFGSHYTKASIISLLQGRGSKTKNIVLYIASGDQRYDLYTASIHANENTYSNIVTKGVVNETAKALTRGLVKIEKNAPKSNGYETQDALLLSDTAEADAIPNLEIHNHDVKCSHGSTVGQIDEEILFYIMSRGLSEKLAKQKIIEGYFNPTLNIINDENLSNKVHEYITNSII